MLVGEIELLGFDQSVAVAMLAVGFDRQKVQHIQALTGFELLRQEHPDQRLAGLKLRRDSMRAESVLIDCGLGDLHGISSKKQ